MLQHNDHRSCPVFDAAVMEVGAVTPNDEGPLNWIETRSTASVQLPLMAWVSSLRQTLILPISSPRALWSRSRISTSRHRHDPHSQAQPAGSPAASSAQVTPRKDTCSPPPSVCLASSASASSTMRASRCCNSSGLSPNRVAARSRAFCGDFRLGDGAPQPEAESDGWDEDNLPETYWPSTVKLSVWPSIRKKRFPNGFGPGNFLETVWKPYSLHDRQGDVAGFARNADRCFFIGQSRRCPANRALEFRVRGARVAPHILRHVHFLRCCLASF